MMLLDPSQEVPETWGTKYLVSSKAAGSVAGAKNPAGIQVRSQGKLHHIEPDRTD